MNQRELYDRASLRCSRVITRSYSTSFTFAILCLDKPFRGPIYSLYGFVRFADEIVDTFRGSDNHKLLNLFREDTHRAIEDRISMNPVLNSFQKTVHQYNIEPELYDTFLKSMEMDLTRTHYDQPGIQEYILGSAQVVGLMCLRVFTQGKDEDFQKLKPYAMSMGAAFQKINFLRDLNEDFQGMGRTYFPGIDLNYFSIETKKQIEENIDHDFRSGFEGIRLLPKAVKLGMYVAYVYYYALFKKIKNTPADAVMSSRIRIPNSRKISILAFSYLKHQFNLI